MKETVKSKAMLIVLIAVLVIGVLAIFQPNLTTAISAQQNGDPEAILQQRMQNAIVLYAGSSLAQVNNAEIQVESSNTNITPYVKQGRALVPLRFIAQNLQAQISWEQATSAVTLTSGSKTIRLLPGDAQMSINGKFVKLDAAPEIVDGRTFVPLRAISEAFGKKVFYDRGLVIIGEKDNPFDPKSEKSLLDRLIAKVNNLPTVDSAENLAKLLVDTEDEYSKKRLAGGGIIFDMALPEMANGISAKEDSVQSTAKAPEMQNKQKAYSSSDGDYSRTNTQVQGVDEADIVKTDGQYLYHVNNRRVLVTKAYPAAKMQVVATLNFAEQGFQPQELYLDEQYLVVIGRNTLNYILKEERLVPQDELQNEPQVLVQNDVKVIIYDIQDKTKITKVREIEVEGSYLSSRKIGSYLYFVTNCPTYRYYDGKEDCAAPVYRDTAINGEFATVPYGEIRYIRPVREANYLVIAGLDLAQQGEKVQLSTYLGAGENIYVSQEHLYVALQRYNYHPIEIMTLDVRDNSLSSMMPSRTQTESTQIYKFSLDQGKVTYLSKGEVPGTLLNQFSMDEHNGYFRVATTVGNTWSSGRDMSQNNVYVLDDSMSMVGKVEGIAPGERIYSTRFMGDRAYLVTFKDTDPFFVLDLKEPSNPRILGALKIPGYSDYLHPYDENHIIGIGKDTIEVPVKNGRGTVERTQAYYQGMKLAVFDVTDVTNPKEMFKEVIGDRGTDSELLRDHKALLFDREKELLAFPVRVMEIPEEQKQGNPNAVHYGQFTFQGAYVYQLNLTEGFSLRGKITHLTEDDLLKAGYYTATADKEIRRILYIGDVLYTVSDGAVKANGMTDIKEIGGVALP